MNWSLFFQTTFPPTGTYTVVPGIIVMEEVNVIMTDGCGVGVGVGIAVVFTTTTAVVGTGVGGTVVTTTVVGTGVGTGVATGAGGWDVQPARRIPMNRIARTTNNFFMHHFLLFRYIRIFN